MLRISFLILLFISASCNQSKDLSSNTNDANLETENFSEMSRLMNKIYNENKQLKQRISRGDTLGNFPQYFLKISSASLTRNSDRDEFFGKQAKNFIEAQRLIYEKPLEAKENFNNTITTCIQCHQVKCLGPIPKIKKLYIK